MRDSLYKYFIFNVLICKHHLSRPLLQSHAKQKFPLDFERNPLHAVERRRKLKKMKKTNLFAILTLATAPALLHAQTTNFSDIVGYQTSTIPVGEVS